MLPALRVKVRPMSANPMQSSGNGIELRRWSMGARRGFPAVEFAEQGIGFLWRTGSGRSP
jgi:hypothetical protein